MSGNTIGQIFRVTTWGESHGHATGAVIDGCPPGIALSPDHFTAAMARRKGGSLVSATARSEADEPRILSGVYEGVTTGTPIAIAIHNADSRSGDYDRLREVYRPGHGDITYDAKYGHRDHRGGGRASGRETAARVAAGEIARAVLAEAGVEVLGYTVAVGGERATTDTATGPLSATVTRESIDASPLLCPDPEATSRMLALLDSVVADGDSIGGVVELVVRRAPAGLGEPVFEKLDAALAAALMSIGTVKAVEIGAGVESARLLGSEMNDPIVPGGFGEPSRAGEYGTGPQGAASRAAFRTNHAGGILAGISDGDDIVVRIACKPIPSISIEQDTVDRHGNPTKVVVGGRHDACVLPRIVPVAEAMVCIVLADHLLRQRAIQRPERGEVL